MGRVMAGLLTTREVAKWLNVHPSTLVRMRQIGQGPRVLWLTASCPRYRAGDVESWLAETCI